MRGSESEINFWSFLLLVTQGPPGQPFRTVSLFDIQSLECHIFHEALMRF